MAEVQKHQLHLLKYENGEEIIETVNHSFK